LLINIQPALSEFSTNVGFEVINIITKPITNTDAINLNQLNLKFLFLIFEIKLQAKQINIKPASPKDTYAKTLSSL
jgi:hypothetical protein